MAKLIPGKVPYRQIIQRKRRVAPEPETAASLMGPLLARLGGQGKALEFRVFESYQTNVGAVLRARTEPERIAGTTLMVRVESSALAHEMTMLKGEILAKMTADLGPNVVVDIRTRVGPLGQRATFGPRP